MSQRRAGGVTRRPLGISRWTPAAAALATAVLLFLAVSAAAAHDGGPRLVLEPNQVNPGGVVLVRGEDLDLDESMTVDLVGESGRARLAAVATDGQGHFTTGVQIPADLPAGTYAVEVVTSTAARIRSLVRVDGAPVIEGGQGAPPAQDEGFPALPLTLGVPASVAVAAPVASVGPAASAAVALRPLSHPISMAGEIDRVPFVALAGAIGALGFLVWRTRRPPATETESGDLP